MKKILALVLAFTMLFTLASCGGGESASADGKICCSIVLVLEDGSEVPYDITVTADTNLRDGLLEAGLITEAEHGAMFISTIDQYTADWQGDPARTWDVHDADDNQMQGFFEEIKLEDGATYRLVNIEVPSFDD